MAIPSRHVLAAEVAPVGRAMQAEPEDPDGIAEPRLAIHHGLIDAGGPGGGAELEEQRLAGNAEGLQRPALPGAIGIEGGLALPLIRGGRGGIAADRAGGRR